MTISKERFEQLALEVANEHRMALPLTSAIPFAHALIKRVEEESETAMPLYYTAVSIVALPLVGEL